MGLVSHGGAAGVAGWRGRRGRWNPLASTAALSRAAGSNGAGGRGGCILSPVDRVAGKAGAQQRADRLRACREEPARMETEGVLALS